MLGVMEFRVGLSAFEKRYTQGVHAYISGQEWKLIDPLLPRASPSDQCISTDSPLLLNNL
jgi:hypothetical protein